MSKNKKKDIKVFVLSAVLLGGTMLLLFFATVKALGEGCTPTEVYNETCIRPTLEYVEAAENEKNAVAEIATTTNEIAAHIPLAMPIIEECTVEIPKVRYALTDEERAEIERVVMAECGAEPYDGILAVCQCILDGSEYENVRPTELVIKYLYTPNRVVPSHRVIQAVRDVFDNGVRVKEEVMLYFYAPEWGDGSWHEKQRFVVEIGGHRFFTENNITK